MSITNRSEFQAPHIRAVTQAVAVDGGELIVCEAGPKGSSGQVAPVVLIHGWSSNRDSLAPQFDFFGQRRRTIALDLRGHGDSSALSGPYSVAQFAADLIAVSDALGLDQPVLIGHSMGGAVALEAVRTRSDFASAVVLLDGYGCYPDAERNALGAMLLQQIAALGFAPVMEMVAEQAFFLEGADPELKQWVKSELIKTDQAMAVEAYTNLLEWDGAAAAAVCKAPVLNLVSTVPFNLPARFVEHCPHAVSGQTVGAGHFHGIEQPEQVHLMVTAFLDRIGLGAQA